MRTYICVRKTLMFCLSDLCENLFFLLYLTICRKNWINLKNGRSWQPICRIIKKA